MDCDLPKRWHNRKCKTILIKKTCFTNEFHFGISILTYLLHRKEHSKKKELWLFLFSQEKIIIFRLKYFVCWVVWWIQILMNIYFFSVSLRNISPSSMDQFDDIVCFFNSFLRIKIVFVSKFYKVLNWSSKFNDRNNLS